MWVDAEKEGVWTNIEGKVASVLILKRGRWKDEENKKNRTKREQGYDLEYHYPFPSIPRSKRRLQWEDTRECTTPHLDPVQVQKEWKWKKNRIGVRTYITANMNKKLSAVCPTCRIPLEMSCAGMNGGIAPLRPIPRKEDAC